MFKCSSRSHKCYGEQSHYELNWITHSISLASSFYKMVHRNVFSPFYSISIAKIFQFSLAHAKKIACWVSGINPFPRFFLFYSIPFRHRRLHLFPYMRIFHNSSPLVFSILLVFLLSTTRNRVLSAINRADAPRNSMAVVYGESNPAPYSYSILCVYSWTESGMVSS